MLSLFAPSGANCSLQVKINDEEVLVNKEVIVKGKYVKPIVRDLSSIPHAEGSCLSGSVATPQGFTDCSSGGAADGGLCYEGTHVQGCITGVVVTNWCGVGGTAS